MRRVRELPPDMPILHVIHGSDAADGTPPDVLSLREPFTPNQILIVVGSFLAYAKAGSDPSASGSPTGFCTK